MTGYNGKQDDLIVEDEVPQTVFNSVWTKIEQSYGDTDIVFPKIIFWLNGSPGAGKGTHTEFIRSQCGIKAQPVVASALLNDPAAQRCKDEGIMVDDAYVTHAIFCKLIDPIYREGIIVDGYPRTKTQADCVKLLYKKINSHYLHHQDTPEKSCFHIIVLFVDEETSIKRQLKRGKENQKHNDQVEHLKQGHLKEVRKTDSNEEAARKRYQIFKLTTYKSLESLKHCFPFHHIEALGSIEEVQNQIAATLNSLPTKNG